MIQTSCLSFTEYADRLRPEIDAALRACVDLSDGCPAKLREAIAYSLLAPGKRLRPILVLMAAEASGGRAAAAMPAACAVEMVHAYSLIHDDLPAMDDDDLRRGRPSCHKAFGEATAILAGDALLTMAFETLAKQVQPGQLAARCCAALAEAAGPCNMVGGQADDMAAADDAAESETGGDLDSLVSIHHRKTGAMIGVSLRLGAMVASPSTDAADCPGLAALEQYGRRLGLAFQITDDLLDVRSQEAATGKRVGKDTEQGKLTFPGLLGIGDSIRRAEQLIDEACEAIRPLGAKAAGLEAIARYVLERNR